MVPMMLAHVIDHPHLHTYEVAVLLVLAAVMLGAAIRAAVKTK